MCLLLMISLHIHSNGLLLIMLSYHISYHSSLLLPPPLSSTSRSTSPPRTPAFQQGLGSSFKMGESVGEGEGRSAYLEGGGGGGGK